MKSLSAFKSIAVVFAIALVCNACTSSGEAMKSVDTNSVLPDETEYVFDPATAMDVVNAARINHRRNTVNMDERLMAAAQKHADLMGATGKFGHEFGPDTKFKARIFSAGFVNSAGENIGVGYRNADEAVTGWLNSPGHRKILLKRKYNRAGIAFARNTSGRNKKLDYFWVLILGEGRESETSG